MPLLITLVRASIRLNMLKMLKPLDAGIESQRCEAWHAIREAFPRVHTGRLETTIREGALASLTRCCECRCAVRDEDRGQWREELCAACEHALVTAAIAKLNAPANDTGLEYGYYRLRATKEHGEMYCPPCLRVLAIDPHSSGSDWTSLDISTARGGHCDRCGEPLDALPSVASVAL